MSSFAALEQYLQEVKKLWQFLVTTRGLGAAAAAALILTLICVPIANHFAFALWSVISGRMVLYGAVAAILILLLVRPLRDARRHSSNAAWVRELGERFPAFGERIETFVDQIVKASTTRTLTAPPRSGATTVLRSDAPRENVRPSGLIIPGH
jgi:hypothetical protein